MRATKAVGGAVRTSAGWCALVLLAGCGAATDDSGDQPGGGSTPVRSPPSATAGMAAGNATPTVPPERIFVFNTHANEQGEADQRPKNLVASPSTSFTGLEWDTWGGGPAQASGGVQGTWCLPDCQGDPLGVSVELSGAEIVDGTAYYTDYSFTGLEGVPEVMRDRMRAVDSGRLTLPSAW